MAERNYYYIMTKDVGAGPHLIGKLTRLSNVDYQFEYMIAGDKFPNIMTHIPDMDDIHKVYNTDETWNGIMRRVVVSKDSTQCKTFEEFYGLDHEKYNQWDYLERNIKTWEMICENNYMRVPFGDPYERIYFYKEIPGRCFRYDK